MENIDHESSSPTGYQRNQSGVGTTLTAIGVLAGFDPVSLGRLTSYGRYDELPLGSLVMQEGRLQDRFYIVVSGRLEICARSVGREVRLCEAEPGECVGEVNLLEPGAASATVRAIEPSILWSMDNVELRRYLSEQSDGCGALLIGMASCLSRRLRQANELIRKHYIAPIEVLPRQGDRAITMENATIPLGFFDQLKKSLVKEKKIRISTEIKL